MSKYGYLAIAIAFGISTVAIGFSYWQLPYSQIALPNSLIEGGLLIPLTAGIALRATGIAKFNDTALAIGSAFVVVVLVRIVADLMRDLTTHNLWPFELIISIICGLVVGTVAAGIGNLANSLLGRRSREE